MRPPFIVIGISPNGSTQVARFKEDGEVNLLVEHHEKEGFRLPMTLALIDQDNKAIRGEITAKYLAFDPAQQKRDLPTHHSPSAHKKRPPPPLQRQGAASTSGLGN